MHPNQHARAARVAAARRNRQARNAHATTPPVPRPPKAPPLPAHCARAAGVSRTLVPVQLKPGTVLPTPTSRPTSLPAVVWHCTPRVWRRYAPVVDPDTGEETVRYVGMGRTLTLEAHGLCAWQARYYRVWTTTRQGSTQYTLATSTTGTEGSWVRCPNTKPMDTAALLAWLTPRLGSARALDAYAQLTAAA